MNLVIAGAAALGICLAVPANAEPVAVTPEFHSLSGNSKSVKRWEPEHKSSAVRAPVSFESRVQLDDEGQLHLNCAEVGDHRHADADDDR